MSNTQIQEVNNGRTFLLDNTGKSVQTSVFMVEQGGVGLVLEFNRAEIIAVLKELYDLHQNWDAGLTQLLAA